jgi:hypothetical protein
MTAAPSIKPLARRRPISTRITVTIPEAVARRISEVSFAQGRSISNLAAYLLERAIDTFPLEC